MGITGNYTIETTAGTTLAGKDTTLFLYSSFDPNHPLSNFIAGNEDQPGSVLSKISVMLTAGSTYTLVITSYYTSETGTVEVKISGLGETTFQNTAPDLVALDATTEVTGAVIKPGAGAGALDVQLLSLNSGNGDYAGSTLSVARHGGASANDIFNLNASGASFTISGANLQLSGSTFATLASAGGTLTVAFTSTPTLATHALLQNVLRHITYQNSVDIGDVTLDWVFDDGNTGSQGTGGALSSTVSQVVTILKGTPSISAWPTASAIVYGQTLADSHLTGGSGSPAGTFAFTSPDVSPGVGTAAQSVTFTPTDFAHYSTVVGTVNVTVDKASQTIDCTTIGDRFITDTVNLSATASSGLTVSFSLEPGSPALLNGTQLTFNGVGVVTVYADQSGNGNYAAAPRVTQVFGVGLVSQTITFGTIAGQLATATLDLNASASSSLAVSFSVTGPGTITGGNHLSFSGPGSVTVTARQLGDSIYAPAPPVARTFAVTAVPATIRLANPRQMYTGGPLTVSTTTSPSGLAVSLLYAGSANAPVEVGNYAVTATLSDARYSGSAAGTLVIWGAPEISTQPKPVNALVGGTAAFWVGAAGASPMTYQWRREGSPIAGATGPSLSLGGLTEDRAGQYDVVMSNRYGTASSTPVTLKVSSYALWGENSDGQSIPDQPAAKAVALGWYHTLNLSSDGTVTAWGDNARGQCNVPAGLSNVVAISGGAYHSLALKADGTVVTWGQELSGALPKPEDLTNVVAISAGGFHNLALRNDGTVAAWGYNWEYQCEPPLGLNGVVAVSAGAHHSLALGSDGRIFAWGDNTLGQCSVPPGVGTVKGIAAGSFHNMALRTDGTLYGWGDNRYLQLNVPLGLNRVVKSACGDSHCLALRDDGTVVSWGHNQWLQSEAPSGLTRVKDIAAGGDHSAVLLGEP